MVHFPCCDWLVKLFVSFAIGDSDLWNLDQSGDTEVEPDELAETCDPASQRAVLQPLVISINSQECSTARDLVLRLNKTTHKRCYGFLNKRRKGSDNLTTYTFNTHMAKHTFCKTCGVQSFYTPRSNPDGFGVAPHCLDPGTERSVTVEEFCGENWEESMEKHQTIRSMSKPT
ncbi:Centromere protein V [Triplophysa tibetana]|uniref:Centromere protein V n=1 Tax=Triplophysa tibetana TaxID=1572043 RepID=A0A5A9P939_9TELE|nr:Centromere protein V [Triplophysa tibetana]